MAPPYEKSIFINCPFDKSFQDKFLPAILFAIFDCGFVGRCSLELDNAGMLRLDNIYQLIKNCKFGLHDLTNVTLDEKNSLPRFNMPFELGLFMAASKFGKGRQKKKVFLVLERNRYELQKCLSDLAGVDPKTYKTETELIKAVRDWLNNNKEKGHFLPDVDRIAERFQKFKRAKPKLEEALKVKFETMDFVDLCTVISGWITKNPKPEVFVVK